MPLPTLVKHFSSALRPYPPLCHGYWPSDWTVPVVWWTYKWSRRPIACMLIVSSRGWMVWWRVSHWVHKPMASLFTYSLPHSHSYSLDSVIHVWRWWRYWHEWWCIWWTTSHSRVCEVWCRLRLASKGNGFRSPPNASSPHLRSLAKRTWGTLKTPTSCLSAS